jgi:hypothetical protein
MSTGVFHSFHAKILLVVTACLNRLKLNSGYELSLQAAANAANNCGADKNDLVVSQCYVNEGGYFKRFGVGYKGRCGSQILKGMEWCFWRRGTALSLLGVVSTEPSACLWKLRLSSGICGLLPRSRRIFTGCRQSHQDLRGCSILGL